MFDDEDLLLAAAALIVVSYRIKEKRPRIFWVRRTHQSRSKFKASGMLEDLVLDNIDSFKHECRYSFKNLVLLEIEDFEILGNKLGPKVSKQGTDCRNVLPLDEPTTRSITYR